MIRKIAYTSLLALALLAPVAASAHPQKGVKGKKTAAAAKCAVTGEKIANVKTATYSDYEGKRYYFCCPGCKPQFDADPMKFIKGGAKGEYCPDMKDEKKSGATKSSGR